MRRPIPVAHKSGGVALLGLLLLAAVVGAALFVAGTDLEGKIRARHTAASLETLASARAALAGYALSYPERHPDQGYGYLPCPDSGNDGAPAGACGSRGLAAFGRFPYRTLGLADVRDGDGECLWYAVAASGKNNPKAQVFDWDSPGDFELRSLGGHVLAGSDAPSARALAVVFAPGRALQGQQRPPSAARCSGGARAADDIAHYLEGGYVPIATGPLSVHQGEAGNTSNNDLIAWLTTDDIFDALRRRPEFAAYLNGFLDTAAEALVTASRQPGFADRHAVPVAGPLAQGPLPDAAALGLALTAAARHDNWREQARFVVCTDGSACLTASLAESAAAPAPVGLGQCRVAVLFAGERIRSGNGAQRRGTAAEREDYANWFEGPNPQLLSGGGGQLAGYRHFAVADPRRPAHEDVVRCLP